MKLFLQVFFFIGIFLIQVDAMDFKEVKTIKLKKDQLKKILVKYGSFSKLFTMRWTLYKNDGLVVFHSYDKFVFQNVLYLRYQNQYFRQELKSKGADDYATPYLLVKFKEFNYETREAIFDLLLSDSQAQIDLKYLK